MSPGIMTPRSRWVLHILSRLMTICFIVLKTIKMHIHFILLKRSWKKPLNEFSHVCFLPFTECWYLLVNLLGYVTLLFTLRPIKKIISIWQLPWQWFLPRSPFFFCFVFICSRPIGSRRSIRWSTAANAPLRGPWISAPLQSLWRGYDSMWTGKMKLMAGWSNTVLFKE